MPAAGGHGLKSRRNELMWLLVFLLDDDYCFELQVVENCKIRIGVFYDYFRTGLFSFDAVLSVDCRTCLCT